MRKTISSSKEASQPARLLLRQLIKCFCSHFPRFIGSLVIDDRAKRESVSLKRHARLPTPLIMTYLHLQEISSSILLLIQNCPPLRKSKELCRS